MKRVENVFMVPGFSVKDDLRDRNCDSHLHPSAQRIRLSSAMGLVGWTNQIPLTIQTRKVLTNCCHASGSDWKQVSCWPDGWTLDGSTSDELSTGWNQRIDPMCRVPNCLKIVRCCAWIPLNCPVRARWWRAVVKPSPPHRCFPLSQLCWSTTALLRHCC